MKKKIVSSILILIILIMSTQISIGFTIDECPYNLKLINVAIAENTAIATDENGHLWGLGRSTLGGVSDNYAPVKLIDNKKIVEIAAGKTELNNKRQGDYFFAITEENELYGWGNNIVGQLGIGNLSSTNLLTQVKSTTQFTKVSAGEGHTLAIDIDGNLWAWGSNKFGQLGNGLAGNTSINIDYSTGAQSSYPAQTTPIKIADGTKFKYIHAGARNSLAIDVEGNLWAWGDNTQGQLGSTQSNRTLKYGEIFVYTYNIQTTPIKIMDGTKFLSATIGYNHSILIDEQGKVWSSGANNLGQLADETTQDRTTPVNIMQGKQIKDAIAGYMYSMILEDNGTLWVVGRNVEGQLGNGTLSDRTQLDKIKVEGVIFDKIDIGGAANNYATDTEGNIWSWGGNEYASGYKSTEMQRTVPKQITKIIKYYTVMFKDNGNEVKTESVEENTSATAPELTKLGYTLSWDKPFENITSDVEVNAVWTPNTNTSYKVEHYKQNTSLNGYDLVDTENLTGTTDILITATVKSYMGFTENTLAPGRVVSGTIQGDGSLVLKLYYDRNTYTVGLNTNGGTINNGDVTQYIYEIGAVLPQEVVKENYRFAGWYDNSNLSGNSVTKIVATDIGNKTYYAKWILIPYNITSSKYEIDSSYNIGRVSPETTKTTFIKNIETNGTIIKIVNAKGIEIEDDGLVTTGSTLYIEYEGTQYTHKIIVLGDLDKNGKLTITDLSMLNQALTGGITLDELQERAGDLDFNKKMTITDLSILNQAMVGNIEL